jgi:glyceraldehyde-3-phosphate dehydrogenase (NAD(P))
MIQVGINGYGTIGKRVADAVCLQPDMTLVGVAKTRPNYEAEAAVRKGYPLYAGRPERAGAFGDAGIDLQGELDDLIRESDVVVDATPAGVGAENAERYAALDTPAIVQGGESAAVADASFVARANYAAAADSDLVRVVSCNTTGLSRLLAPLEERYGIEHARATLIRRGGDPDQPDRGPINDILPDPRTIPSHHGPDVGTILPTVDITTVGVTVPATLMHLHSVNLTLREPPTPAAVAEMLAAESRLCVLPERLDIAGTAQLKAYAADTGRPRGDLWENCLWAESIAVDDRELTCMQAIHQEANVVPENIDAIRAITDTASATESIQLTNRQLGLATDGFGSQRSTAVTAQPADD